MLAQVFTLVMDVLVLLGCSLTLRTFARQPLAFGLLASAFALHQRNLFLFGLWFGAGCLLAKLLLLLNLRIECSSDTCDRGMHILRG